MPKIQFDVKLFLGPDDVKRSRKALLGLMHALTYVNLTWLTYYAKHTPLLYRSHVIYRPEKDEENWQDIPTMLQRGYGDCEDLACWRCAELNFAGIKAKPYLKWRNVGPKQNTLHATVQLPDGRIIDPAAARGMSGLPVVSHDIFVTPGPTT